MPIAKSKVFLLSPARADGKRASMVMRPEATFELAVRLRQRGAPIRDVFSFMSGLYFRGKSTYASVFANPPTDVDGVWVITSSLGLVAAGRLITLNELAGLAAVPIGDDQYRSALVRDSRALAQAIGPECSVILLGSIATPKYVEPLREVFGDRLLFPEAFIGRGDLSRGGLLLRAVQSKMELPYQPISETTHHGPRPARLAKLIR